MQARCWAVVPAAGVGRRMASRIPKQYLPLSGRRVIDHTLARLLGHPRISAVYVALSSEDTYWQACDHADDPRVIRVSGGEERCHSVLNALRQLALRADEQEWVLVHDAVRPCLSQADLTRLIERLDSHPVGGLLGIPVCDTLKRVDADAGVEATVSRERLWRAFTPQMFRLGMLTRALEDAIREARWVTDDAGAMELAGYRPVLVEGEAGNIKITRPEDLQLAAFYLGHTE
ncbi:MAG: 2-C-methyl-D-erythritol 4-phosphate cytidylyltransferase [Candidatus Thiodiazotropha sp. (ex Dulcina madagascariensis)]|nr:2-C-methyl-D-erythritol 4-phosphate cytidylyltransferase [Candidatus Thiodiazotropha sp. (ex Dulcina madagascariensis)]